MEGDSTSKYRLATTELISPPITKRWLGEKIELPPLSNIAPAGEYLAEYVLAVTEVHVKDSLNHLSLFLNVGFFFVSFNEFAKSSVQIFFFAR